MCTVLSLCGLVIFCFVSFLSAQSVLPSGSCTPSLTSCSFYSECVEAANPCGSSGYALGFGNKFCNLFTENFNLFDSQGQRWIDNARLCLQQALLPEVALAQQNQAPTCAALSTYAFNSHVNCYVDPTGSHLLADSVCSLPLRDWIALIWTVKSGLLTAFSEVVTQMIGVSEDCGKQYLAQIEVAFNAAELSASVTLSQLETAVAQQVATQMGWPLSSVLVYTSGSNIFVVLLATAESSSSSLVASPPSAAGDLVDLVNSAGVTVTVNGQSITLTSARVCAGGACPSTQSAPDSSADANPVQQPLWIAVIVAGGVVLLTVVGVLAVFLWRKTNRTQLPPMTTHTPAAPAAQSNSPGCNAV